MLCEIFNHFNTTERRIAKRVCTLWRDILQRYDKTLDITIVDKRDLIKIHKDVSFFDERPTANTYVLHNDDNIIKLIIVTDVTAIAATDEKPTAIYLNVEACSEIVIRKTDGQQYINSVKKSNDDDDYNKCYTSAFRGGIRHLIKMYNKDTNMDIRQRLNVTLVMQNTQNIERLIFMTDSTFKWILKGPEDMATFPNLKNIHIHFPLTYRVLDDLNTFHNHKVGIHLHNVPEFITFDAYIDMLPQIKHFTFVKKRCYYTQRKHDIITNLYDANQLYRYVEMPPPQQPTSNNNNNSNDNSNDMTSYIDNYFLLKHQHLLKLDTLVFYCACRLCKVPNIRSKNLLLSGGTTLGNCRYQNVHKRITTLCVPNHIEYWLKYFVKGHHRIQHIDVNYSAYYHAKMMVMSGNCIFKDHSNQHGKPCLHVTTLTIHWNNFTNDLCEQCMYKFSVIFPNVERLNIYCKVFKYTSFLTNFKVLREFQVYALSSSIKCTTNTISLPHLTQFRFIYQNKFHVPFICHLLIKMIEQCQNLNFISIESSSISSKTSPPPIMSTTTTTNKKHLVDLYKSIMARRHHDAMTSTSNVNHLIINFPLWENAHYDTCHNFWSNRLMALSRNCLLK